jgi:hypothetical protein
MLFVFAERRAQAAAPSAHTRSGIVVFISPATVRVEAVR